MKKTKSDSFLNIKKLYRLFTNFNILALLFILLIFLILSPTRSKKYYLDNFLKEIQANRQIDAKAFWETRERYSNGSFNYNPNKVTVMQTFRLVSGENPEQAFLTYNSKQISSEEYLVTQDSLPQEILDQAQGKEIILKDDKNLVFIDQNQLKIYFVKNIDEMMAANGFFDYLENERKLLENHYWLDKTTINFR